ncbi:MAG: hypothetical protein AABM32_11185 [Chloroflexota bacterium]
MENSRRRSDDLLEVARVLLLLQGAILLATTIEALIWGIAFAGGSGLPFLMSGGAAAVILVARARLRADRRWTRRLVYGLEGFTLATFAIDTILAIALTGALPPIVAILTRLVPPITVIALLRRSVRAKETPTTQMTLLEGMS